MNSKDREKELAAIRAVQYLKNDQIVGLGTGSTAAFAVKAIGRLVQEGLRIRCVPTSEQTASLARELNIELVDINSVEKIDITIDGADEFTEDFVLIKGGGGALLREKIVASLSKEVVIIADSGKKVSRPGKFHLPAEVVPFAQAYVKRQLTLLGGVPTLRMKDGKPFSTDQQNCIIDTDFGLIDDPQELAIKLNQVEGLVGHGLFINLATRIIMGEGSRVVIFEK